MLIILFPYKFTNFFFKKYQIKELKKKFKKKFEIHDVSNIISKKQVKIVKSNRHESALVFDEISEWKKHLKKIIQREKKVFVVNLIFFSSFRGFYIHYLLFRHKVSIVKMHSPEVPLPITRKSIFLKIFIFFKLLLINQSRLIFIIKELILRRFAKFFKFNELYVTICGSKSRGLLNPLDTNAKKIKFIDFHASDFSNYLSSKSKNNLRKKNYIVFLDIKAPAFAGDDVLFNKKIIYNVEEWYKDLNSFLNKVEKEFSSKVIIIPHPSVRKLHNIYYDKKLIVSKDPDATNKLVPNCKFVIANGATTAASYCIIYNKPITFIYSDQVIKKNPSMVFETKYLSKILSSKTININKNFSKKQLNLNINKKKYLNYKYNFLTSKKIKDTSNSEILKKIIIQNKK